MKKITAILLFIIIAFTNIVYAEESSNQNQQSLNIGAQGAVLMDFKTGRVLWEKNSNNPLAMASTTKIMTAIIAIENGNLNDIVKVSKKASLTPPVKMHLKEGEEIKLENLLYALMMQSSNDAAVAIAEHIGGSVEEFCSVMTEKAKEIGAKNTVFETPNGLDSGNHHSTAYDMAVIARYALSNSDFLRIINTKEISFSSNVSNYSIINKNRFLSEFEGANGIKTGYTGKAGHCFVGAAKQGDMQLISVVLASGWGDSGKEKKWSDTKKIMTYGFENFKYKSIVNYGDDGGKVNLDKAREENINLYFENGIILPMKDDEDNKIKIVYNKPDIIEAPIKKGDKIGTASIYFDNNLCAEVNLLASSDIERHDFETSMKKIIKGWINMAGYDI